MELRSESWAAKAEDKPWSGNDGYKGLDLLVVDKCITKQRRLHV